MENLQKDFVPYELALKMKQLGFDEPGFAYYYTLNGRDWKFAEKTEYYKLDDNMNIGGKYTISAPLFQQAFRWFRDNYNLFCEINVDKTMEPKFAYTIKEYESVQFLEGFGEDVLSEYLYYKHEEAELACLEKLIEIVEQKEK